jgi:hypothetical protein
MDPIGKVVSRKRSVVGWRQAARRVTENRTKHRTPPPPAAKPES